MFDLNDFIYEYVCLVEMSCGTFLFGFVILSFNLFIALNCTS